MTLPPGFRSRPAAWEDAATATSVVRAFEEHETGAPETTVDDVEDWWRELDPAKDVWLIAGAAGEPAAYGAVYRDGEHRMQADGYVLPPARGRGLGTYLVDAMEARACECGTTVLTNGVLSSDAAAQAILTSAGYTAARRFARMLIDMESAPAPARLGAGLAVRPFEPGRDDERFHDVLNQAFAEHWGHVPETFDRWRELTMGSPRFDPSLWFVAEENGALLGIARCTWKVNDIGWVNDLGVLPVARRRGIALGLLTRAFAEFYARGERTVGLGVDTQNETGATRLYERAGMRTAYTAVIFEKRFS